MWLSSNKFALRTISVVFMICFQVSIWIWRWFYLGSGSSTGPTLPFETHNSMCSWCARQSSFSRWTILLCGRAKFLHSVELEKVKGGLISESFWLKSAKIGAKSLPWASFHQGRYGRFPASKTNTVAAISPVHCHWRHRYLFHKMQARPWPWQSCL